MFLSMLTADAAAQHGHEFSAPRTPSPLHRASPAPRSPLNVLSSTVRQQRPQPTPLPARKSVSAEGRPSHASSRKSIMFALPPESNASSSRPPSIHSTTTTSTDDRSRKRPSRPKTNYALAHPPPRVGPLHLRPKVLLQLHQSSANSRPKPAYEAIPSTTFAPRLKRKFHRVFKHRDRLGPDDVVIVRAGDYGGADDHSDSDEDVESREVIGVVCFNIRDERTEICMDDDTVWAATFMQNGGYEFVTTDEHGLQSKARWVPKPQGNRRKSANYSHSDTSSGNVAEDRKFTFSTISPDRRRHPVIATMTRAGIDVWDQYSIPYQTNATTPLASPTFSDAGASQILTDISEPRPMLTTNETLRKFILVSGIWVAFREKWSTAFRYERPGRDRENLPASPLCGSPIMPCAPIRTVSMASMNGSMSRSSSPGIPDNQSEKHHSLRSVSRMLLHRNSALAALNGECGSVESTPPSTAKTSSETRSRRANSTGTAFIKRASSKRNPKRHSSGSKAVPESPGKAMYRINTEEDESEHPHRFTLSEAAHIMLPMIEDRTPKNSGEYASSLASSHDEEPTPRALPRRDPEKQERVSLQVQSTYLQPNSASGQSDGAVEAPARRSLPPSRSKSTRERSKPRHSVSLATESRYYGNGTGYANGSVLPVEVPEAFEDEKEIKMKKRMSVRGFLQRFKSKRGRN